MLVPGLAFAPEFQLQALGYPAESTESWENGARVTEQQSSMAGWFQDTLSVGVEKVRKGMASCFRQPGLGGLRSSMLAKVLVPSVWIYGFFPDPPGYGLSGDGGDRVPT